MDNELLLIKMENIRKQCSADIVKLLINNHNFVKDKTILLRNSHYGYGSTYLLFYSMLPDGDAVFYTLSYDGKNRIKEFPHRKNTYTPGEWLYFKDVTKYHDYLLDPIEEQLSLNFY